MTSGTASRTYRIVCRVGTMLSTLLTGGRADGLSCVASRHIENVCVCVCAPYLLSRTKQSADSDDIRTAADAACTTTGEDKNGERGGGLQPGTTDGASRRSRTAGRRPRRAKQFDRKSAQDNEQTRHLLNSSSRSVTQCRTGQAAAADQ